MSDVVGSDAQELRSRLHEKMALAWPVKGEGSELPYRNLGYVVEFRLIYRLWRTFHFNGRVYKLRACPEAATHKIGVQLCHQ